MLVYMNVAITFYRKVVGKHVLENILFHHFEDYFVKHFLFFEKKKITFLQKLFETI